MLDAYRGMLIERCLTNKEAYMTYKLQHNSFVFIIYVFFQNWLGFKSFLYISAWSIFKYKHILQVLLIKNELWMVWPPACVKAF